MQTQTHTYGDHYMLVSAEGEILAGQKSVSIVYNCLRHAQ